MKLRSLIQALVLGAAASLLAACGGGGSGSDLFGDSSSSSGGSTGGGGGSSSGGGGTLAGCGSYTDIVTSSEREQANACGIQVSSLYGAATAYLADAVAACQRGDTASADQYYSNYKQSVAVARQGAEDLSCGTDTGGITAPQPSTTSYYNLCVSTTVIGGTTSYTGYCYGGVSQDSHGCGNFKPLPPGSPYTYAGQYPSKSACDDAANQVSGN